MGYGRAKLWRRPFRTVAGIWTLSTVIMASLGPFGSYPSMPFGDRLLYWGAVIAAAICLVTVLRFAALRIVGRGRHPFKVDALVLPTFTAIYTPLLYAFSSYVATSPLYFTPFQFALIVAGTGVILIGVREGFGLHAPGVEPIPNTTQSDSSGDAPPVAEVPALIERLPDDARGPVFAISGADHYVEVHTARGKASVLLRFSDAMRELGEVPGQQVHRSHWVADDAVDEIRRDGHRHFVVLKTGHQLPVSRTYLEHAQKRWG